MSHVKEENLRASAVHYMRRQLGQGKSLAKLLLETVDFSEGNVMTLSPTPLSPAETIQFDWGHTPRAEATPQRIKIGDTSYLAVPKVTANEQLVEAIYDLLQSPESVCLLENSLAEARDSWLRRAKSRVVTNGSEVYHALFNADRDKSKIEDGIREWHHLPTSIGALGRTGGESSVGIASLQVITREQLTAFAQTVQSVFVGAYDGEGYVVWNGPSR